MRPPRNREVRDDLGSTRSTLLREGQTMPSSSTSPAEVVQLDLSAGSIQTTLIDGLPHIVLKPAVEELGLDYPTQLAKLRTRSWATVGQSPMVADDGKVRPMAVVPV